MAFRCPELIGRDREFDGLETGLGAARAGRGRLWFVAGPTGVGKSALAAAVRRRSTGPGPWIVARCSPNPSAPLRLLREAALAATGLGADPTAEPLRLYRPALAALMGGVGTGSPPADPVAATVTGAPADGDPPLALVAAEAFLRLAFTVTPPPVVLFEDVHWADNETLDAIEYLADHVEGGPMAILATLRSDEPSRALDDARRMVSGRRASIIELTPLPPAAQAAMIERCLGAPPPAGLAEVVKAATEGFPFLIEELLDAAADNGRLVRTPTGWRYGGGAAVLPPSFTRTIALRLDRLGPTCRRVVAITALAGREIGVRLLGRLTGEAPAAIAAATRAGTDSGLFDATDPSPGLVRFRHALTADAVVRSLEPAELVDLAGRALAALPTGPLDDEMLEVALRLAQLSGAAARRAELLVESGLRATARGALSTARQRLEQALDEGGHPDPVEIRLSLLDVHALAGDADTAGATGAALIPLLESRQEAERADRAHAALARACRAAGRYDEARLHLGRLTPGGATAGSAPTLALEALVDLETGDHAGASQAGLDALTAAEAARLPAAECEAIEVLGRLARFVDLDEARRLFSRGHDVATRAGLALWRARAAHELATIRQLRTGEVDELMAARDDAVEAGALSLTAAIDFHLGALHGVRFEPEPALAASHRCLELARRTGSRGQEAFAWCLIGQAQAGAGRRAEAEAAASAARNLAPDDPEIAGVALGACVGLAAIVRDDRARAVDAYREAVEYLTRAPNVTPVSPWYLWPLLATVSGEGREEGDRARLQADLPALRVATGVDGLWHLADAAARAGRGDREGADRAWRTAESRFAEAPGFAGYAHIARRIAADSALAEGWGQPLRWLADTGGWATARGLDRLAAGCRSRLRGAGVPQRRRGRTTTVVPEPLAARGVTGREVEVLVLLAEGLTNRQIGERLYLSPRTVKSHVEHLLTKTGRRNRVELAALAPSGGPTGPGPGGGQE